MRAGFVASCTYGCTVRAKALRNPEGAGTDQNTLQELLAGCTSQLHEELLEEQNRLQALGSIQALRGLQMH